MIAKRPRLGRTSSAVGALLLAAVLGAVTCGCALAGGSGPPPPASGVNSATIGARSFGQLGTVLVDSSGATIYVLTRERGDHLACTGSCAEAWPPVLLPGGTHAAVAGLGVQRRLLGFVKLPDGQREVTYARYPLHTYVGDTAAGDDNGEGVQRSWFVISTVGAPARSPSS